MSGTPGAWSAATDEDLPYAAAYGVALLSRYPVSGWQVVRLPAAPGRIPHRWPGRVLPSWVRDEARVGVVAEVATPAGPVRVVNTHLSFLRGWNVRQLRVLLRGLGDRSGPMVLLGDLNMGRATAERVTGLRPLATGATFPAHAPSVQIDHLLATPGPGVSARVGRCGCRCRTTSRSWPSCSPGSSAIEPGSAGAGALQPQRRSTGRSAHDKLWGEQHLDAGRGEAPPMRSSSARQAAAAISIEGCRTVVSGGSVNSMSIESSDPTTDRSRGTSRPRCRAARSTPRAITSDPQTIAVTPRSSSAAAACAPPATVNVVHSTRPSRSASVRLGSTCSRIAAGNAPALRRTGV